MNKSKDKVLNNMKILLVEDDDFTRQQLERFLRRRVGKILTATNGAQGLEILKTDEIDIVITDLKMPNMTGLEMIQIARENDYDGPVIIISALSDTDTILKAVDMGIVKYIIKPIDTDELVEILVKLSKDIMKNKFNGIVIDDDLIVDKERKVALERDIGRKIAHFLKSYTGKGPKNIQVFIQGNNITVQAEEILTLMEQNIVSNVRNYSIVDYNRRLFYSENKRHLEQHIEDVINHEVNLIEANCNSSNNLDLLKFSFK
ncbi:Na-translocating system protein MpsC family protein [Clostridium sp. Cult3]|uniref:Na-translocating system protein MpsC family protein n=1 Tax=Clostridium sp. Cult3 TaxID=2079004 RepID=UPI001F203423|nr:Na-translocating system protein MpsC family protein [Clostridium sp. Cult3]MCF6461050.1 response regulator [Clostridium sp. Cult3]